MSRVEKNHELISKMQKDLDKALENLRDNGYIDPRLTSSMYSSMRLTILADISQSLAVIADKLSQEEDS